MLLDGLNWLYARVAGDLGTAVVPAGGEGDIDHWIRPGVHAGGGGRVRDEFGWGVDVAGGAAGEFRRDGGGADAADREDRIGAGVRFAERGGQGFRVRVLARECGGGRAEGCGNPDRDAVGTGGGCSG